MVLSLLSKVETYTNDGQKAKYPPFLIPNYCALSFAVDVSLRLKLIIHSDERPLMLLNVLISTRSSRVYKKILHCVVFLLPSLVRLSVILTTNHFRFVSIFYLRICVHVILFSNTEEQHLP